MALLVIPNIVVMISLSAQMVAWLGGGKLTVQVE